MPREMVHAEMIQNQLDNLEHEMNAALQQSRSHLHDYFGQECEKVDAFFQVQMQNMQEFCSVLMERGMNEYHEAKQKVAEKYGKQRECIESLPLMQLPNMTGWSPGQVQWFYDFKRMELNSRLESLQKLHQKEQDEVMAIEQSHQQNQIILESRRKASLEHLMEKRNKEIQKIKDTFEKLSMVPPKG